MRADTGGAGKSLIMSQPQGDNNRRGIKHHNAAQRTVPPLKASTSTSKVAGKRSAAEAGLNDEEHRKQPAATKKPTTLEEFDAMKAAEMQAWKEKNDKERAELKAELDAKLKEKEMKEIQKKLDALSPQRPNANMWLFIPSTHVVWNGRRNAVLCKELPDDDDSNTMGKILKLKCTQCLANGTICVWRDIEGSCLRCVKRRTSCNRLTAPDNAKKLEVAYDPKKERLVVPGLQYPAEESEPEGPEEPEETTKGSKYKGKRRLVPNPGSREHGPWASTSAAASHGQNESYHEITTAIQDGLEEVCKKLDDVIRNQVALYRCLLETMATPDPAVEHTFRKPDNANAMIPAYNRVSIDGEQRMPWEMAVPRLQRGRKEMTEMKK
ncbi:hypothetical protein CPB86DRAFT_627732 [Serendipita vermifera]|nr:hypothetical protein CPB86DRAFT_627732 [Serendipita vermifera]